MVVNVIAVQSDLGKGLLSCVGEVRSLCQASYTCGELRGGNLSFKGQKPSSVAEKTLLLHFLSEISSTLFLAPLPDVCRLMASGTLAATIALSSCEASEKLEHSWLPKKSCIFVHFINSDSCTKLHFWSNVIKEWFWMVRGVTVPSLSFPSM